MAVHWRIREIMDRLIPARGAGAVSELLGVSLSEVDRLSRQCGVRRCSRMVDEDAAIASFLRWDVTTAARVLGCYPEDVVAVVERRMPVGDVPDAHYRRWGKEENKALERCSIRRNWSELAVAMGKTKDAVKSHAYRAGLTACAQPPWSEEDDAKALKMLADGLSSRRVGMAIGRSGDAVRARARILQARQ